MKKFLSTLILAAVFTSFAIAETLAPRFKIAESEEEFDITCYQTSDMKVGKAKKNQELPTKYLFTLKSGKISGEIRYTLFTDLGGSDDDLASQILSTVVTTASNISGQDIDADEILEIDSNAVAQVFNADLGLTFTVMNPKSSYAKGFKYMTLEYFYKHDQGLVLRVFLYNDLAFAGIIRDDLINDNSLMIRNYATFVFMEK